MALLDKDKILVTGGAGFIGSALVWALNSRGIKNIVISDILGSDEKWKNLVPLRYDYYIEASDLQEKLESKPDYLGKFGAVFHLGACSSTTERDASYLVRNNYEFTRFLCEWTLNQKARFVYASSAATYGNGAQGMDDKEDDLARLRPLNMYGYSKHMFDRYAQRHGLLERIVGLKYFNVFGPNENHKGDMRSVVNKAFQQIRDTGKVSLFKSHHSDYKDGEQMRDFLYVKDAVKMTLHLADSDTTGIFNVGSGKANTWLELVKPIFPAMNRPTDIEFIDMPEQLRSKYQYYTCADIEKLRNTGYQEEITPLEDAVTDYVENYLLPGHRLGW